jgi:arylsulfatase A-like enzyme
LRNNLARIAIGTFVAGLLLGGARWALSPATTEPAPSAAIPRHDGPNVLVIVWDTTRADRLSLYGHSRPTTPRLDAWAKRGVVFDRAISPAMWTPPSHSSMFTGFAPTHHGVEASNKWLDDHHTTIAEWSGQHGYRTFLFSANPYVAPSTNITQGFQTVLNTFTKPWRGEAKKATVSKLLPNDASSDISPAWVPAPGQHGGVKHAFKDAAPVAARALTEWLDASDDAGQPWFAFLNMMEAHIPRVPSQASREAVIPEDLRELALTTDASQIQLLAHTFGKKTFSDREIEAIRAVYDAAIRDMDAATGALLDDLEARGDLNNTIVVLTADHGENLGDHAMFGHKYNVYDTLLHVPLVVWWPDHLQPKRVSSPVSTLDLFPTLLDAMRLPAPPTAPDGRGNWLAVARDGVDPGPVFSELNEATPIAIQRIQEQYGLDNVEPWLRTFRAVEQGGWKYIEAGNVKKEPVPAHHELFYLPDDPGETRNLYAERADQVAPLTEALRGWVASIPVYDPSKKTKADDHVKVDRTDGADMGQLLEQLGYAEGD